MAFNSPLAALQIKKTRLGRKMMTSSPISGVSRSQLILKKTNVGSDAISGESSSISQSLEQTNQILVEIQKQLSYDFAMRIAEEKQTISQIKKAQSKTKFAKEEKSLESTGKITSTLGETVNKVTAPFASIFDKIKEFFTLVLTGILLSAAFKWLSKEENRKKVEAIFSFITKYWKEITVTLLGIKLFGALGKLVGFVDTLTKISKWFRKNPARTPGGGGGNICSQVASCFSGAAVTVTSTILEWLANNKRKVIGVLGLIGLLTAPQFGEQPAPVSGNQPTGSPVPAFNSQQIQDITDALNQKLVAGSVLTVGFVAALLKFPFMGFQGAAQGAARGGTINKIPVEPIKKEKCSTCSLGFSEGGSVGGRGSGIVDSVRAMLAPGEEVIRTASAMLFRPLLKDINDNAGRLWGTFTLAVQKLLGVVSKQKELAQDFGNAIEKFNRFIEQEKARKILDGNGGGGETRPVPRGTGEMGIGFPNIKPSKPKSGVTLSSVPDSSKSGGMNFLSMVLPTKTSKPPEIPEMQEQANGVNVISPINILNPYMDATPELYGISYLY
jgi:hypothetical protein